MPSNEWKAVFWPFVGGLDTATAAAGAGPFPYAQWAELFGGTLTYQPSDALGARFVLELPAA